MAMDDDDHEGQAVSVAAHEEEEMEVFESYIVRMLTNLGQFPLERIQNMLKMFVAGSAMKYNKTPQQLSLFMQHLCEQEKLEFCPDGTYKPIVGLLLLHPLRPFQHSSCAPRLHQTIPPRGIPMSVMPARNDLVVGTHRTNKIASKKTSTGISNPCRETRKAVIVDVESELVCRVDVERELV